MTSAGFCIICYESEAVPTTIAQASEAHLASEPADSSQPTGSAPEAQEFKLHVLPCGNHAYCLPCFVQAIETGIKDETCYDVACDDSTCKRVPMLETEHAQLIEEYLDKGDEYKTPHTARIYCSSSECAKAQGGSRFLNAAVLGNSNRVMCPDCHTIICTSCKETVDTGANAEDHECSAKDQNASLDQYLAELPENERWRWQRCYRCRIIVEKTEACNHMTCRCGGEFCVICGSKWTGPELCGQGCPKYGHPQWDSQGTGNGDGDRDEDGFDDFGMDQHGYDRNGFNYLGFNREGLDARGFDGVGYDTEGYDPEGFNRDGLTRLALALNAYAYSEDENGDAEAEGVGRLEDANGFDPFGYDAFGYNADGFNRSGYDRDGYDADDLDAGGYNRAGFNTYGFDQWGYDMDGLDGTGYDRHGFNAEGYDSSGYNKHHTNANGDIQRGFYLAPDGNVHKTYNSPLAAPGVFECDHTFQTFSDPSRCGLCDRYISDWYYQCSECGADLCETCHAHYDTRDLAYFQRFLGFGYPSPGRESLGIKEMFIMVEAEAQGLDVAELLDTVDEKEKKGWLAKAALGMPADASGVGVIIHHDYASVW